MKSRLKPSRHDRPAARRYIRDRKPLLPVVQDSKAYNRSSAPGTTVVTNR